MQPNGMPQFGGQNNNRNNQMAHPVQAAHGGQEPLFSANPNFVATGSAIAEKKKNNVFTNLKKEQILPALVAIFGFLALIFLVSTMCLHLV